MPGPDLHVHSTASDGAYTPAQLVSLASALGLSAIALTDHDTVGGVAEAVSAAEGAPLTVIPGVELSAGIGERSVHILGYYVDDRDPTLLDRLARLRQVRLERAERIVGALRADGFDIDLERVLKVADGGAVGRAHIAQLLVDAGSAPSVSEAFQTLLGRSAPYYVPKPVSSAAEVVSWVCDAGGVAVLAHPGLTQADDLIPELVAAGIVGLEAYHGAHDAEARERYERLAERHGLIVTGGSDFHGDQHEGGALGSADVPESVLPALAAVHEQRCGRL